MSSRFTLRPAITMLMLLIQARSSKMRTFLRLRQRLLSRRRLTLSFKRNTRRSILLTTKFPDGPREFMVNSQP